MSNQENNQTPNPVPAENTVPAAEPAAPEAPATPVTEPVAPQTPQANANLNSGAYQQPNPGAAPNQGGYQQQYTTPNQGNYQQAPNQGYNQAQADYQQFTQYQNNGFQTSNGRIYAILSYLYVFLWLIGLLATPEKDDPKVKFHVNQGIWLTIISFGSGIVLGILGFIPFIGWFVWILRSAISIYCLIAMILGISNAAKGIDKPIPIFGGLYTFVK